MNHNILTLAVGQMAANCYLVFDPKSKEGVVIDPGDDAEYISDMLVTYKILPRQILATHGHFDHIMAAFALQNIFRIPFAIHPKDVFLVDRMAASAKHFLPYPYVDPKPKIDRVLCDHQRIKIGEKIMIVHHTPGHTPGSVCFEVASNHAFFVGDTIFQGGAVGRTDHEYAKPDALNTSIRHILSFPRRTKLYPGHGELTSVGSELGFHVQ